MKKFNIILITVLLILSVVGIAKAETFIAIGDPEIKEINFENGTSVKYYETRVLVSTAKHESGLVEIKKEEVKEVPVTEEGIKVTYSYEYE